MTSEPSGRLYSAVTKHWPRIAAGLVVGVGLVEFVVGGLTADSGLEFYLMAWAATTGGVWFLFEKAETALSEEARQSVVGWVRQSDFKSGLNSIPDQFSMLFDRVFGERHLSLRCFASSALASVISMLIVLALWLAIFWPVETLHYAGDGEFTRETVQIALGSLVGAGLDLAVPMAVLMNIVPDYLSLLETRAVLAGLERGRRILPGVTLDFLLTTGLSAAAVIVVGVFALDAPPPSSALVDLAKLDPAYGVPDVLALSGSVEPTMPDTSRSEIRAFQTQGDEAYARCRASRARLSVEEASDALCSSISVFVGDGFRFESLRGFPLNGFWRRGSGGSIGLPFGIFFYSAFFTSVWLWLYAASVLVSRVLLRMNNGVGFLLRVTDVERQPFRSMGFVSVIIVSALFALGLPLVLL